MSYHGTMFFVGVVNDLLVDLRNKTKKTKLICKFNSSFAYTSSVKYPWCKLFL